MLSNQDFQAWCVRLAIPAETYALIQHIRTSPPSRRVRSGVSSVSVRYPSLKMGIVIQAESHRESSQTKTAKAQDAASAW